MAAVVLSKVHRVFHCFSWRHPTVSSLCSVATHLTVAPALDADRTYAPGEVFPGAIGLQNTVWQSDPVPPPLSSEESRVQVHLRVLGGSEHGLQSEHIPRSTWRVLENLHDAGYEAYLVGGSIRDLLLKQVPKDFDVLSTADPREVKRSFPGRCFIVGKRFPICHVYSHGTIIEVSSFSTKLCVGKKAPKPQMTKSAKDWMIEGTEGWDARDFARWENCLKRDFTINGLMYDPFKHQLYDYVGGLRDLKKLKVRTVIPAEESFTEDSARILRGIRIAARLGFSFTKSTGRAIKNQRFSLLKINKGRLMLEANMFFSYGAAEPSLRLLWRYGLLELLLPLQAAYFVKNKFKRRDTDSNLLLDLLRNLDKVVAPDRPCHGSLWLALFAFHLAISDGQSSPVVIAAAALTMYHTDNRRKAAQKAQRIHLKMERQKLKTEGKSHSSDLTLSDESIMEETVLLLESSKACLNQMMDSTEITQVMQALTGTEPENLAAVGQTYFHKAFRLFRAATEDELEAEFLENSHEKGRRRNKDKKDPGDPEAVTRGDPCSICYVFSRIVLNTLYPRATIRP